MVDSLLPITIVTISHNRPSILDSFMPLNQIVNFVFALHLAIVSVSDTVYHYFISIHFTEHLDQALVLEII